MNNDTESISHLSKIPFVLSCETTMTHTGNKDTWAKRAAEIATAAHQGQCRRNGAPYISHPRAVADRVKGDDIAEAIAWLHDTLEDTGLTVKELIEAKFPQQVIDAVILLTKTDDMDYNQYLLRLKKDTLAKKVKIADLLANLSDDPSDKQIVKYSKALLTLMDKENP